MADPTTTRLVRRALKRAGSITALAKSLKVQRGTVKYWLSNGIPEWRRDQLKVYVEWPRENCK